MFKWIQSHIKYSRHEQWLEAHFNGSYITAREGSWILTAISDRLEGVNPDSQDFTERAVDAIASFRRPDAAWGHVLAVKPPHLGYEFVVPEYFFTVDAVRIHTRYIRELRGAG